MAGGINKHFKNETILMVAFFLLFGLMTTLAAIFGPKIMEYIEVDKCLDAGGLYNYKESKCNTEQRNQEIKAK